METPFSFGVAVMGKEFVDRAQDQKRLHDNFNSGINTMLISPRRWGKSSLVRKAVETFTQDDAIHFAFIDLFNVTSEQEFYSKYASAVINATSSKTEEAVAFVKEFFKKVIPQISVGHSEMDTMDFGITWKEDIPTDEILDLPEKIAQKKGIRIVICIDEFQNISTFTASVIFQRRLRAHWQLHQKVRYCLYGSKRHLLTEFFSSSSMPFYKFGDVIFLEKIELAHWVEFIQKRFKETGKSIGKKLAGEVAGRMECHSYYVQQFAYYVWISSEKKVNTEILEFAMKQMLKHNQMLYRRIVEDLPVTHIQFLKALVRGELELSSRAILEKYNLGTSANIIKIKASLENREIIDNWNKYPEFADPLFKIWFRLNFPTV